MAVGEIVGSLAALVHSFARLLGHAADDLRSVGPGPENGTPPSDSEDGGAEAEGPTIYTGPDTYTENPGHRGDELMHAETRRSKWYAEDELKARAHGTRKIGF